MSFKIEINPELKMKSDIMFKAFYGRKENEEFLQDFLEAVLGEKLKIKKVMHDVRLEQLAKEQKFGILDLGVELENGEFINVEIQIKNYNNIEKRTTFYASKKLTEQLGPGEDYRQLKTIIIIAILDYSFIELPEYITETVRVAKEHREYEINNDVKYYYIELEKFRKQNPDMTKRINQWSAFLDMERRDLLEMACKENDKVKRAVENYEVLTGDEEVKRLAEIRLMSKLEEKSAIDWAREDGIKQGKEIGREEGREEGRKKGLEEGREQEKIETTNKLKEIAKKLKEQKMPIKQIAEITGLSEEEIESINKD